MRESSAASSTLESATVLALAAAAAAPDGEPGGVPGIGQEREGARLGRGVRGGRRRPEDGRAGAAVVDQERNLVFCYPESSEYCVKYWID